MLPLESLTIGYLMLDDTLPSLTIGYFLEIPKVQKWIFYKYQACTRTKNPKI